MEGLRAFLGLEEEKHILYQCREAYIYNAKGKAAVQRANR